MDTNSNLPTQFLPLQGYLGEDGRFRQLPGKRQKKLQRLMFEYFATKFQSGVTYTEQEVNDILTKHHSFNDPASLRRFMIGMQLLSRTIDGREYWVEPTN